LPVLRGFALALVAVGACFPNPDSLRPSSSSGSGGAGSPAGGSTGSGGTAGTAGHSGAGGTGAGGTAGTGAGGNAAAGSNGAGGVGAPGSGGRVGAGGNGTSAGGTSGGVGGAAGYVGSGLALTPDATGFIAATSNAFAVTGSWYAFGDGYGPDGTTTGGSCESAGHPPSACSVISSPSPTGSGFPNTGGKMCVTGVAARVVNNTTTGQPDFGGIYGVTIGFDFNYAALGPPKGTFNAISSGITGIQFDVDLVPSNGLRAQFVTPGTDLGPGGPSYWGGSSAFPPSPAFAGTNRIYWADVTGPYGLGLDPTQLVSMYFNVPTQTASADSFHFCISNVALIRDAGPLGRTCATATFPVYCPAANGVPANCWTAGTNCNTVTSCAGVFRSCFGQAQTDYYDCTQQMCLHCSGAGPLGCPGLGTVPPQCWAANVVCSTVTDCGGGDYEACTDPSLTVDCATLTCN
jgi:hypothetical protein